MMVAQPIREEAARGGSSARGGPKRDAACLGKHSNVAVKAPLSSSTAERT